MSDDPAKRPDEVKVSSSTPAAPRAARVRLWPAVAILVLQWGATYLPAFLAPVTRLQFGGMLFGPMVGTLAILVWWLTRGRVPWRHRLLVLVGFFGVAAGAGLAMDRSMRMPLWVLGLPLAATVWVGCVGLTGRLTWTARAGIIVLGFVVSLGAFPLLRMEGTYGSLWAEVTWRWRMTPEDVAVETLAEYEQASAKPALPEGAKEVLTDTRGDWAEFRGPRRDGQVHGVRIETNWSAAPPAEVWRRPVGPGWSSFAVVGRLAFTQEQRGDHEAVVCYHADTGQEVWAHLDPTKFDEAMGGVGPRATPTVHEDALYALGANGTLNCLAAASGEILWSTDITVDTAAPTPTWGFSSSPLVWGDLVVVCPGSAKAGMVAYDRASGQVAWTCKAGTHSYSSPHLARVGQTDLVLMMSNTGLTAADPATGSLLWDYQWPIADGARIVQPAVLDGGDMLIATGYGHGTRRIRPQESDGRWQVADVWESRALKPYFNDFVCHQRCIYGFDARILACVDLASGDRVWKGGRYGHGQLLLLADQDLLLVLSERGDVALVDAKPAGYREVAALHALDGKTWNHPVVARGKLFVRNAEEAACYRLTVLPDTPGSAAESPRR